MLDSTEAASAPADERGTWRARFFDGRAPMATPATASFEGGALVVRVGPEHPPRIWAVPRIEVVQGR